ncbi:unnamed protein product [Blepharisma stoltei]|uniref:Uncharacterized protein n=1 Tax=Blepharisma stoltei TaxID=1481888 RepID=A0AAU9IQB4_9CILI|nr:unnamed protein product [Blepharisma stoltei]
MWSKKQKQTSLRAAKDEELQVLDFGRDGYCYGFGAPVNVLPKIEDTGCHGKTLKFYLSKFVLRRGEEAKRSLYSSFIIALEANTGDGEVLRILKLLSGDAVVTFGEDMAWKDLKDRGKIVIQHEGRKQTIPVGPVFEGGEINYVRYKMQVTIPTRIELG